METHSPQETGEAGHKSSGRKSVSWQWDPLGQHSLLLCGLLSSSIKWA